jgi:predicted CoA-binding protein
MYTLVFGASLNPVRYSHLAIERLVTHGVPTLAYGLKKGLVAGISIDTQLMDYNEVDTVTLYLNPQRQKNYYDYIISLKPNRVIFNPGTENPEFWKLLQSHKISYEVACTLTLLTTGQY